MGTSSNAAPRLVTPSLSDVRIMEPWWYLPRLVVIIEMRGNVEEHLGCSEVLFDHCLF
jgi:hypothetical protein